MSDYADDAPMPTEVGRAAWPAVFSLTLGVFGLVTAEFLPASLLTPMARALDVSESIAGQAVTATAVVAFFAGLLAAIVTRGLDRRRVLMGFSALLIASSLLVAAAPAFVLLLLARILLGIAIGGFWSMAAAVAIRLVPPEAVPRAMSMVFSGVSVAMVVAVPLGTYIGGLYGWRAVFVLAAAVGAVTFAIQWAALPRLPMLGDAGLGTLARVLRRPGIGLGMVCVVLVFGLHCAMFTYIRPFLEIVARADDQGIALFLMAYGLANFAGTFLAGIMLERSVRLTLGLMPVLIALAGLGLVVLPAGTLVQTALVALWGLAFGAIPVSWSTWLARAVPDETESGGGLIVAAVQVSIALGAAGGGAIYAIVGISGLFATAGALMLATSAVIFVTLQARSST